MKFPARLTFAACVLALLTLALFRGVPSTTRWQRTGPNLTASPSFAPNGSNGWRTSGNATLDGGRLQLEVDAQHGRANALQHVSLTGARYFEVRARARLSVIDAEHELAALSRMVLVSLDAQGAARFDLPHGAGQIFEGAESWAELRRIVRVDPGIARGDFGVRLQGENARLELESPALFPVRQRTWFTVTAGALLLGWLGFIAGALRWTFRAPRPRRNYALLAGVLCFITISSAVPSHWTGAVTRTARSLMPATATAPAETSPAPTRVEGPAAQELPVWRRAPTHRRVQKIGHFGAYLLLALAAFWSCAKRRLSSTLVFCLSVALLTELIQFFSAGRTSTLLDVGIDMAGVLLAVTLLLLFAKRAEASPTVR